MRYHVEWSKQALRDMRRMDKPLVTRITNAVETFADTGYGDVKRLTNQESDKGVQDDETINETETSAAQINSTNVHDINNVHISSTQKTATSIELIRSFKDSVKRETVEDTHTRKTFIVRNDLLRELDKLSKKQGRGFQTWFVNKAFERLLADIQNRDRGV